MKNKFTASKLQWYGAIASSVFITAKGHSQVVYTDINPDVVLGDVNPGYWQYLLDLNHDGQDDYRFTEQNLGGIIRTQAMVGLHTSSFNTFAEFAIQLPPDYIFPQPVASGFIVPDDLSAGQFSSLGYFLYTYSSGDFTMQEDLFYNQYIPLKLTTATGDNFYGWVRVSLTPSQLVIKDYAFNSTANQSIDAGDKGNNVVCVDNLEPNNVRKQGTRMRVSFDPVVAHAMINPASDVDWFRYKITSGPMNIRIILSDLPANYNVKLYNSSGAQIGQSSNNGISNDTIIVNDSPNDFYYVKVTGKNGAFDATSCYSLSLESGPFPFRQDITEADPLADGISIFPNPAHKQINLDQLPLSSEAMMIKVMDLFGREVKSLMIPENTTHATIAIDDVPAAVYFVQVLVEDKIYTKKIVIE